MRPFVKWVGGKQRSLKHLLPLIPHDFRRYHEPFLGGGAVFLALAERGTFDGKPRPFLSDWNFTLVETWKQLRDFPEETMEFLADFQEEDSKELFHFLRRRFNDHHPDDEGCWHPGEYAATFVYLNRAGYNGLFRVNQQGEFNGPFSGNRTLGRNICPVESLNTTAYHLGDTGARLRRLPYYSALDLVEDGDFAYLDPPYHGTYTNYTFPSFTEKDQIRLAQKVWECADRGAKVIVSNSDTPLIRELYEGFRIVETTRVNSINSNASDRSAKRDLTICSWSSS